MNLSPRVFFVSLSALLLGCEPGPGGGGKTGPTALTTDPSKLDEDDDGVSAAEDCDDQDASIYPGAEELCDSLDNNCDGAADEGLATAWYPDADTDGYGDEGAMIEQCEPVDGAVSTGADCDDADAGVNPDAVEQCDSLDNDCDGLTDDDDDEVSGAVTWYIDGDGDGYGQADGSVTACDAPAGGVAEAGDCDDSAAQVYPGAEESDCADPIDYNCDGSVGFSDNDGDGWAACEDCDDGSVYVSPSATETCDGLDNDCDGLVDSDDDTVLGVRSWYLDSDGDGYGDSAAEMIGCEADPGYVEAGGDCDDADVAFNPGVVEADCADPNDYNCDGSTGYDDADGDNAPACEDCNDNDALVNADAVELCDGIDNNCDGELDEATAGDAGTWYLDQDGDGFGDASTGVVSCEAPTGHVGSEADCDDADAGISPDALEVCDDLDNDCDDETDEDSAIDAAIWYDDVDGDGFGDPAAAAAACEAPPGSVADMSDCDDVDGAVSPDAEELCDGIDNNCDGVSDEDSSVDAGIWYVDGDGDGFGDPGTAAYACSAPPGSLADPNDCDDTDAAVNPDAVELCDGIDNNCQDGSDEDTAVDASVWYQDVDGDGFGDANVMTVSCVSPAGFVADSSDCDDDVGAINPVATEICDGIDNDCDLGIDDSDDSVDLGTATDWYADIDGDGFGDADDAVLTCDAPLGSVADDQDCDDTDRAVHPDALEICDTIDNDCDRAIDDADGSTDLSTGTTWYADRDGDSFGDADDAVQTCAAPTGYLGDATDCDDTAPAVHPDATEVCDGIDNDCDGLIDDADDSTDLGTGTAWYGDGDGDGFGDADVSVLLCLSPADHVADSTDCDDTDDGIFPDAAESWYDGIDSNCDGDDYPDACDGVPGTGVVSGTCTTGLTDPADWEIVVEWTNDSDNGHVYAAGPTYTDIMAAPAVGQLTDDNGDGVINELDMPDIAYTTFAGGAYSSAGYLRVVAGDGSGTVLSVYTVTCGVTNYSVMGAGGVAIADLENDGSPDILVNGRAGTTGTAGYMLALENTGACKWASATSNGSSYTAPAVADLDADGDNEVIAGATIYNANGTVYASGLVHNGGFNSYAVDLDVDGDLEVIAGSSVYSHTGVLVWNASRGSGRTAVGDFDGDGLGEVAINNAGTLTVLDTNGTVMWGVSIGSAGAGAPCVGDFDGDGDADVAAAGASTIRGFTGGGATLWTRTIRDSSSSSAACSTFDFDGDGAHEVVYADEYDLFILDGATGVSLYTHADHASGTLYEFPVIADVDNDGNVEIVDVNNDYAWTGWDGVHVLGEVNDRWANARNMFNSYNYYVTNADDDGFGVPSSIGAPWTEGYDMFRGQAFASALGTDSPDLAGEIIGVCTDCSSESVEVYATIANTGSLFAPAGLALSLYADDGAGGLTLLETQLTPDRLEPGVRSAPYTFTADIALLAGASLYLLVDAESLVHECDESDNISSWDLESCPG